MSAVEPARDAYLKAKKKHKVHNNFFSKDFVKNKIRRNKFDLVITRQVLEHVVDLNNFLKNINFILNKNGMLVIEVPDHSAYMENLDYGLWEEHCNYFTLSSLENLLIKNGFEIVHYETTLFSGRIISIFARRSLIKVNKKYFENLKLVSNYKNKYLKMRKSFQKFIENKKVAIYGCGARSSNVVNFLFLKNIQYFIDDQQKKINNYVPGYNLKIKKFSKKFNLDIILMGVNTENEKKIIKKIPKKIKIFSILPPSRYLPEFWQKLINN